MEKMIRNQGEKMIKMGRIALELLRVTPDKLRRK
jgi:hypothetical protein